MTLLFNGRRLGIALSNNNATQIRTVLAGHILPSRFAFVFAEMHLTIFVLRCEKNTPTVIRHFHMTEVCPAFGGGAHCCTQVHIKTMRAIRPHILPPLQIIRLPMFQCTLQCTILREVYIVRNFFAVVNGTHDRSLRS